MFHFPPLLKLPRSVWLLVVACASLAGCLADNGPIVEVRPRLVVAPQNPTFQAINFRAPFTGDMCVRWNRSIADTQLNFKGYFVKLYSGLDTGLVPQDTILLDSIHIARTGSIVADTFYTFKGEPVGSGIPFGNYTVFVWGEKTSATIQLSADSSQFTGLFDPRPLQNPAYIEATSVGPTQVNLMWPRIPADTNRGFLRYVVYYRDTTNSHDTAHVAWVMPPGFPVHSASVNVPPASGQTVTTSEYPYQFWVKAERNDSTYFYGSDTNAIVWAGAETVPRAGNDSSIWNPGYLRVQNSMYFGPLNGQPDVAEDTTNGDGQVKVNISGSVVTLTVQAPNGVGFLDRMDEDSSLDSIYYTGPLNDPTQFTKQSLTLPATPTSSGVIVYLMMNDNIVPTLGHQWARIFIHAQANKSFVNPNGGIDIKASFQPGISKDGGKHLPFY